MRCYSYFAISYILPSLLQSTCGMLILAHPCLFLGYAVCSYFFRILEQGSANTYDETASYTIKGLYTP